MEEDPLKPRQPPLYYPKSDDLCTDSEHVTFKNVLFGFKAFTTAHGVPHVDQARGLFKKVCWLLFSLAGVCVMLMQISTITVTYRSNPVQPVVLKQSARSLVFPAVTVCNTNPVKASALQSSPALKSLVDSWEESRKRRKKRQLDDIDEEPDKFKQHNRVESKMQDQQQSRQSGLDSKSSASRLRTQVQQDDTGYEPVSSKEHGELDEVLKGQLQSRHNGKHKDRHGKKIASVNIHAQATWNLRKDTKYDHQEDKGISEKHDAAGDILSEINRNAVTNLASDEIQNDRSLVHIKDFNSNKTKENINVWDNVSEKSDFTFEHTGMKSNKGNHYVSLEDKASNFTDTFNPETPQSESGVHKRFGLELDDAISDDQFRLRRRIADEPLIRDKRGTDRTYYCKVVFPYGTYCLIDELHKAVDIPYVCEDLGHGYEMASLETHDKVYDVEQSFFFSKTLLSKSYIIGLYNDQVRGFSWLSGERYSYNQWRQTPQMNLTFEFTMATIQNSGSHVWEPAGDDDMGLPFCYVTSYADLPTTTARITSSTTSTPTSTTPLPSTTPQPTTTTEPSIHPDREPIREDFQQTNSFLETLADLPEEVKVELGYQPEEFILDCVYDGKDCMDSEFGHFFDTTHGNCYSFNSGWHGDALMPARKPGRANGLSMVLNIGQYDYTPGISEIAGAVVVVHSQSRMPFPEDEGVLSHAGQLTSIGLNQMTVDRLGGKYSDCFEESKDPERNVFEEHHQVNYSAPGCYKTCYQKHLIERCGCYDSQYPGTGTAFGTAQVHVCDSGNRQEDDCMYGVLLDYIANELDCNCPIPCSEEMYTHSISRTRWPADVHKDRVVAKYADQLVKLMNYSTDESYLYRNILKIEVYFDELNYEYIYEKPKYPIVLYIADFASLLGLWLGLSVLSIAEVMELAVDLIVVRCKKILKLDKPRIREFSSIDLVSAQNGRPPLRNTRFPTGYQTRLGWSEQSTSHLTWDNSNSLAIQGEKVQNHSNILTKYMQMLALGKFKAAKKRGSMWNGTF